MTTRGSIPPAETLIAALPHPAAVIDSAGRVQFANAAMRRALGGAVLIRPGDAASRLFPVAEAAIAAALQGRTPEPVAGGGEGLLRVLPAGGGALLVLEPPSAGGLARLEILGRLAGGIAHDFNNLLAVVMGAAAALRPLAPGEPAQMEIEAIDAAAQRGAALVRQLLAFARQQVMAPRVIDLNDSIRQVAVLLPRLLGGRIDVTLDLEEPSRRIRVDPSQWDQVLLNLLVNARDAMEGKGRLRLATGRRLVLAGEALKPGRYAVIEVTDSGPGIAADVLPRIFEPFFSTKLERGGTGLGLATVQGIIGQFGGQMEVDSTPGLGSTFRILLPRHDGPPAPEPPPAIAPEPPTAEAITPSAGPVLLVDDEPSLLRVARLCLSQAGFVVETAGDAEEAMERIEAGLRPALVATDVAMPGMDGLALARAVRRVLPAVPVLLLSGYSLATVDSDLATEGFRFLAKPYTPDGLRDAVRGALEKP